MNCGNETDEKNNSVHHNENIASHDHHHHLTGGLYFGIWRRVASFCQFAELCNLAFTSSVLHEVCDFPPIWNNLVTLKNLFPIDFYSYNFIEKNEHSNMQPLHHKANILGLEVDSVLTRKMLDDMARDELDLALQEDGNTNNNNNNNNHHHHENASHSRLRFSHFPKSFAENSKRSYQLRRRIASIYGDEEGGLLVFVQYAFFDNTAKRFFKNCRAQLELLLQVNLCRIIPFHCFCALYFDAFDTTNSKDFWDILYTGERGLLREQLRLSPAAAVVDDDDEDFKSNESTEVLVQQNVIRERNLLFDLIVAKKNSKNDTDCMNCLPMKLASLLIRNSLLRHVEYVAALSEVCCGLTKDYYFVTYFVPVVALYAPLALVLVARPMSVFEIGSRFLVQHDETTVIIDQQQPLEDNNNKFTNTFMLFQFLVFIVPHFLLILEGGGFFGVFYSMKRLKGCYGKILLLLFLNNVVRPFFYLCAILMCEFVGVNAIDFIPFSALATLLLIFVVCLFVLSSKTGKRMLAAALHFPIRYILFTLTNKAGTSNMQDANDNVARRISSMVMSFLSNKMVRFALTSIIFLGLSLSLYSPTRDFFVNAVDWLGCILFAVSNRDDAANLPSLRRTYESGAFCLLRWCCSVVWCLIMFFLADGRNTTLEGKYSSSTFKRQLCTIACSLVSIRFEMALAQSQQHFQNVGPYVAFIAVNFFTKCLVGLFSDLYRCYYLRNKYDHEVFKLNSVYSGKLQFFPQPEECEDSLFFEQMQK